jgi:hypothetical protein
MGAPLPTTHELPATLEITDILGNPAPIVGVPRWSLPAGQTLVDMAVAADGLSAIFTPIGALGTVAVTVHAQPEGGGAEISDTREIDVIRGAAGVLTIRFGEARPRS